MIHLNAEENYSLSNGKPRSSSATTMMVTEIKEPEVPRAKPIRRHQTVTHAGAGSFISLNIFSNSIAFLLFKV